MATEEEVEAQKNRVIELRAQLEEARTGGAEHQKAVENDMVLAQLKAEEARLEAELAVVKEQGKSAVVEQGASAPLASAKDQMSRAVAHQKAVAAQLTQSARDRNPSPVTPTDADSTNTSPAETAAEVESEKTTTPKQAANKADKLEGAK